MDRESIVAKATSQGVRFILECIQGGLDDYANSENYGEAARRIHSIGLSAAIINSHIIHRAKTQSLELPELIRVREKRGRITFILGDYTEIWYKKLDKDGRPRFRPSKQALQYIEPPAQQLSLKIDLPPEKDRWVAGYKIASAAGTQFQIVIAGREATGSWWEVPLTGGEIHELFPIQADLPAATLHTVQKRVRIRQAKEAKKHESESGT